MRRINVSLDTLDAERFAAITRRGRIEQVLDGMFAAKAAGLAVKINAVALKGVNEGEIDAMLAWCGEHGFDLCLIETMPLGEIGGGPDGPVPAALDRAGAAARALDAGGDRLPHRRPGALFHRGRDRPADRLHHADDP